MVPGACLGRRKSMQVLRYTILTLHFAHTERQAARVVLVCVHAPHLRSASLSDQQVVHGRSQARAWRASHGSCCSAF